MGVNEERRALLRRIIERLHEGASPDEVRLQLRTLVRETEATEIAAMEQSLIDAGMPVAQIRKMCDLHSQVLREILTEDRSEALPPGHPIDTFERENAALMARVGEMRSLLAAGGPPERARELQRELSEVDRHYQRKEHLLFACLERHGVSGPTQVMWGKDDEARQALKTLGAALASGGDWRALAPPALAAVEEMVYKEEKILFPMSRGTLTPAEWDEIARESPRYGWCLIAPRGEAQAAESAPAAPPAAAGAIALPTGELTPEQLLGILRTLPVELTFVDAEDRVRFFSPAPDPIFSRSVAILGRTVQLCHPPKSVATVDRILADFRAGRHDVAEFWMNLEGRFVHIRYFAVRDAAGAYLGALEVTQDLTRIRGLEGERRLLHYD